jgi:nitroimidazol reductase NimA-like FMN-containing flavoprotein (pyridoxamine 5'-phosphate oxidase superfamily)
VSSPLTYESVLKELRKRSFAVLSTADENGHPHAVGVEYGVSPRGDAIYVMTRRQLKKVRNISANSHVAVSVPLTRRLLWFLPPPSIQFQGTAEILEQTDEVGIQTFSRFFMGRRILRMYEEFARRGETRVCFIRIVPVAEMSTYMVGHSILELMRRMEVGIGKVAVPAQYRLEPHA